MKISNVSANAEHHKEMAKSISGKIRRKLKTLDTDGMIWSQKKALIIENLLTIYNKIPDGIIFAKRSTKDIHNPDGLRIFVKCQWIKRNRFHDNKGIFPIGSLVSAINKQIEGKTKSNILANKD